MRFPAYSELSEQIENWGMDPAADLLQERTVLITGAGDGIGAATAKTLALFGANVVLLGRTRSKLENVFDWIEHHTSSTPVIVPADLAELTTDAAQALHDSIADTYGSLHGIVHNASMLGPKVPLAHYPPADWQKVMQVNANAPFLLTRGLFPLLDTADDASVIFMSSSVGREGRAYWGAYSASKFALEGISQIFADETESAGKIRVYSVNPGATRTGMRAQAYPMEDPQSVAPPEQHMELLLRLVAGPRTGRALPPQGSQLDARTWQDDAWTKG